MNQLHEVVDELLDAGRPYGMGLECGSKAELIASLPQIDGETLLVCNGVKDRTMLSLMIAGAEARPERRARHREVLRVRAISRASRSRTGYMSQLGVRVRLATRGSGRWSESSGTNSKFGLNVAELVRMVNELEAGGQQAKLVLLHCHLGSQIADIQVLKQATKEVAQIYARAREARHRLEVPRRRRRPRRELRQGPPRGGRGHQLQPPGVRERGRVHGQGGVRRERGADADARDRERPRAHGASLRADRAGARRAREGRSDVRTSRSPEGARRAGARAERDPHGAAEDAQAGRSCSRRITTRRSGSRKCDTLFTLGYLPLEQRALAESLYWRVCSGLLQALKRSPDSSRPEIIELEDALTDLYLCDFSVFQSMLDHWAIGQPFPIVPIDRLDERPDRRAVLVDLTCDSDGKVSHYVSSPRQPLPAGAHARDGEPYYLGFFLMGAYEDIIGDAHNLFGRVPEVHVYADAEEPGYFWIEKIIHGTAVQDMLAQVQYFPNDLHRRMSELVRAKIQANVVRPTQGMEILDQYMACFPQTTYCDHARHRTGSAAMTAARPLKVGLVQMSMGGGPGATISDERDRRQCAKRPSRGAQLVVLPELFRSRYFCQSEDAAFFELAESVPGPSTEALARARERARRSRSSRACSRSARPACITTRRPCSTQSGGYLGKYRKMHIPDDPRYYEKFYFTPGRLGVQSVRHARGRARRARVLGPVVSRGRAAHGAAGRGRSSSTRPRSAGIPRRRTSTASASTRRGKPCSAATRSRTAVSSSP